MSDAQKMVDDLIRGQRVLGTDEFRKIMTGQFPTPSESRTSELRAEIADRRARRECGLILLSILAAAALPSVLLAIWASFL